MYRIVLILQFNIFYAIIILSRNLLDATLSKIGIDMKLADYNALAASSPVISKALHDHVGPPILRGDTDPASYLPRRRWIQDKLTYAVTKPWDEVDLAHTDNRIGMTSMHHTIYLHIGGREGEKPAFRSRFISSADRRESIAEALAKLVEWHKSYWALQRDCPLVIDGVVRMSERWQKVSRWQDEMLEATINIWLPPPGYQP